MTSSKASNKTLSQQQTAARKPPTVRVASPATAKRLRRMADAEAATIVPAPTFELAENDSPAAEEEGAKPLSTIPYTGDTTPFPTAQGSLSVTDAPKDDVILNAKRRKLLDGEDDDDKVDDDTDKDEDDKDKDMGEDDKDNDEDKDEDDTDTAAKEATKITTPSKSETVAARTS
jgi:hypothetical protein